MRYRYTKKYLKSVFENDLPELSEDERIYLNVNYRNRYFAKECNCGFDSKKKLWFTGAYNSNICFLVDLYGVNSQTSNKALSLLKVAMENKDRKELLEKIKYAND